MDFRKLYTIKVTLLIFILNKKNLTTCALKDRPPPPISELILDLMPFLSHCSLIYLIKMASQCYLIH